MKFQILQENLNKAVNIASRFTSTRAQIPVLGNILISVRKTKIFIASTNLEISVSSAVGAKVEEEGEITVPSKVITELVSNFPKETLQIESKEEHLHVNSKGFSSTVIGTHSSDFPKIPQSLGKENLIRLPRKEFIEALSQVLFATGLDETRPILTGVLFVFEKGLLKLVATDGFRLSQKKMSLPGSKAVFSIVLPKTILSELVRVSEEVLEILLSYSQKEKQAIFGLGETILASRLLEGEYPDFDKILPKSSSVKITTDKIEIERAVKLASIFARESANIVKIKILKDSLKVYAEGSQAGSQEVLVDAKIEKKGPEFSDGFEISFNYRFLEEFFHSMMKDEVVMEFSSTSSAGVFKEAGDENYLHLIMPVRVQS